MCPSCSPPPPPPPDLPLPPTGFHCFANRTQFDAEDYGALLLVDPEAGIGDEEKEKLVRDVKEKGLSLVVFADWYSEDVMSQVSWGGRERGGDRVGEACGGRGGGGVLVPCVAELL